MDTVIKQSRWCAKADMDRRVVITGYGAITPIGQSEDEILRHLTQGISGVKPLKDDGFLSGLIRSGVYGGIDYPMENFQN